MCATSLLYRFTVANFDCSPSLSKRQQRKCTSKIRIYQESCPKKSVLYVTWEMILYLKSCRFLVMSSVIWTLAVPCVRKEKTN